MTVSLQSTFNTYTGNGVATVYAYQFKVRAATDLVVKVGDLTKTLGVDYTVSGVGADVGGNVTFILSAPLAGVAVSIERSTVASRSTDYQQSGDFLAAVVNNDFDSPWLKIQELEDELSRVPSVPTGFTAGTMPAPDDGKFLRWKSDLTGLENADIASIGTIGIPVPIASGGTGASTQTTAIRNLGFIDVKAETALIGGGALDATALQRAFLLADSGAPVNYTITLPSGSPVGSLIMFRVHQSSTKLYTIAGSDVGIDGSANRVMWRNESCLLMREAASWTKVGGRTIPFRGALVRTAQQVIAAGSFVPVDFQDEVGDAYNLDLCFDTVNGRFKAPRGGSYQFNANLSISAVVTVAPAIVDLALGNNAASPTGAPSSLVSVSMPTTNGRLSLSTSMVQSMSATDFVEVVGRITAGGGGGVASQVFEYVAGVIVPSLSYQEIPLW